MLCSCVYVRSNVLAQHASAFFSTPVLVHYACSGITYSMRLLVLWHALSFDIIVSRLMKETLPLTSCLVSFLTSWKRSSTLHQWTASSATPPLPMSGGEWRPLCCGSTSLEQTKETYASLAKWSNKLVRCLSLLHMHLLYVNIHI